MKIEEGHSIAVHCNEPEESAEESAVENAEKVFEERVHFKTCRVCLKASILGDQKLKIMRSKHNCMDHQIED